MSLVLDQDGATSIASGAAIFLTGDFGAPNKNESDAALFAWVRFDPDFDFWSSVPCARIDDSSLWRWHGILVEDENFTTPGDCRGAVGEDGSTFVNAVSGFAATATEWVPIVSIMRGSDEHIRCVANDISNDSGFVDAAQPNRTIELFSIGAAYDDTNGYRLPMNGQVAQVALVTGILPSDLQIQEFLDGASPLFMRNLLPNLQIYWIGQTSDDLVNHGVAGGTFSVASGGTTVWEPHENPPVLMPGPTRVFITPAGPQTVTVTPGFIDQGAVYVPSTSATITVTPGFIDQGAVYQPDTSATISVAVGFADGGAVYQPGYLATIDALPGFIDQGQQYVPDIPPHPLFIDQGVVYQPDATTAVSQNVSPTFIDQGAVYQPEAKYEAIVTMYPNSTDFDNFLGEYRTGQVVLFDILSTLHATTGAEFRDYHHRTARIRWSFGDVSDNWRFWDDAEWPAWCRMGTDVRDRNNGTGPIYGHVYESPGVYTVSVDILDEDGNTYTDSVNVTVNNFPSDPGTNSWAVSNSGNDMNSGTQASPLATVEEAISRLNNYVTSGSNRHGEVLLERDSVFTGIADEAMTTSDAAMSIHIGAYGAGARPIVEGTGSGQPFFYGTFGASESSDNVTITDIHFRSWTDVIQTESNPGTSEALESIGLHNCLAEDMSQSVWIMSGTHREPNRGWFVSECEKIGTDSANFIAPASFHFGSIMGNKFDGTTTSHGVRVWAPNGVVASNVLLNVGLTNPARATVRYDAGSETSGADYGYLAFNLCRGSQHGIHIFQPQTGVWATNVVVERNVIWPSQQSPQGAQRAFGIDGPVGCEFRNNIIVSAGDDSAASEDLISFRIEDSRGSNALDDVRIYNNTTFIPDSNTTGRTLVEFASSADNIPTILVRNNIIVSRNDDLLVVSAFDAGVDLTALDIDYTLKDTDPADIDWANYHGTVDDLTAWQARQGTDVLIADPNSLDNQDPLFIDDSSALYTGNWVANINLGLTRSSPAVDAGVRIPGLYEDYFGTEINPIRFEGDASFTAALDQITRGDGQSFIDDGFFTGQTITITGTTANDGTYTINGFEGPNDEAIITAESLTTEPLIQCVIQGVDDPVDIGAIQESQAPNVALPGFIETGQVYVPAAQGDVFVSVDQLIDQGAVYVPTISTTITITPDFIDQGSVFTATTAFAVAPGFIDGGAVYEATAPFIQTAEPGFVDAGAVYIPLVLESLTAFPDFIDQGQVYVATGVAGEVTIQVSFIDQGAVYIPTTIESQFVTAPFIDGGEVYNVVQFVSGATFQSWMVLGEGREWSVLGEGISREVP